MAVGRMLGAAFLACLCLHGAWAQDCVNGLWDQDGISTRNPSPAASVSLAVPAGTTLQVALDKEVRVKKVGQRIHGRLLQPVYVFDREVIAVGSEVVGRITRIQGPGGGKRFLAALNMDFTPRRKVQVEFDEIILPDGKHIPLKAVSTPGSGQIIQLITTADADKKKPSTEAASEDVTSEKKASGEATPGKKTSKDGAAERMKEAVRETKRKWQSAMKQIKKPGRMRRLGRFMVAQLPIHPHYLDAGTVYFAELKEPLDFGSQRLSPQPAASNGTPLPPCSLLAHAQLVTPLDSATTKKDAAVEAVLTHPIFSGDQLLFPQGSLLKGSVVQAQAARSFGRNGVLRIAFNELIPPDGMQQKVVTTLEGVQASKDERVKLDAEGGAKSRPPKTRYASTGVTAVLAMMSHNDTDTGVPQGTAKEGVIGGAAGFKLVGIVVGAAVQSRPLSLGMGIYGLGRSAYSNFVARGYDVEFPKGTALAVGLWLRRDCVESAKPESGGMQ